MKINASFILGSSLALAACTSEPVGYMKLSLPNTSVPVYRAAAEGAEAAPTVSKVDWAISVSAEDMDEPIVQEVTPNGTSGEILQTTIPVRAGADRLVRVAGRGTEGDDFTVYGFDGESLTDVAEEGETSVDVTVFSSVTYNDNSDKKTEKNTIAPLGRSGGEAPASAPDINQLSVSLLADGGIKLIMTFANQVEAPWSTGDNAVRGLVEFDTDLNAATGNVSNVQSRHAARRALTNNEGVDEPIGVDVAIDLSPVGEDTVRVQVGEDVRSLPAQFVDGVLTVTVPAADVGKVDKGIRLVAMVSDSQGSLDFAPEINSITLLILKVTVEPTVLVAVTSFEANTVAGFADATVPYPVIRSSPLGLHAAWANGTGFDYGTSFDGRSFGSRQQVSWRSINTADRGGIDMGVNARGVPTVVMTQVDGSNYCYSNCISTLGISQGNGSTFHPVISKQSEYPLYWDYYGLPSIAVFDDVALISDALNDSYATAVSFFSVSSGQLVNTANLAMVASSAALTVNEAGLFRAAWATSYDPVSVSPLTNGAAPSLGTIAALPALSNIDGMRGVASGDKAYFVASFTVDPQNYSGPHDLTVFDEAGVGDVIAGANVGVRLPSGTSYPDIAISKNGRIGVVWAADPDYYPTMSGAPGRATVTADPLAVAGVYYAERLPGETVFSAPIRVGNGEYASVAFDALEQPVVLVSDLTYSTVMNQQTYQYDLLSSQVTAYRGQ